MFPILFSILFLLFNCTSSPTTPLETEIKEFDILPKSRGLNAEHYPTSNERRIDFFMKPIQNLGGCYIGVGTDQNFSFIAKAKSERAWLMDFDPVIVKVNLIHLLFIEKSNNYEEFRNLWLRKNKTQSFEIVKAQFEKDPEYDLILKAWETAHRTFSGVEDRLNELNFMTKKFALNTFSNNPDEFLYLKKLVAEKKIKVVNGDLTGSKTLQNISKVATNLNCKVRILYLSNAEEYFRYPENMRTNFLSIPIDEKSLVIRTMTSGTKQYFGYPEGEKFEESFPLHYNIQPIESLKAWMKFRTYFSTVHMLLKRETLEKGFSIMKMSPLEYGMIETGDIITKTKGVY
jgi:hypothetical protein